MSQDSFSFETRAWSSSEGDNSHVKLSYKKRRVEVRFRGEVIEIAYFAPSGRRGGGGAQKDAAGRDVPLRRIELKPWSILSLKNIFLDFESDTEFEALEKAFQIRHADATGEVEERWFAKFMPQELIDRFALYDEEHLGGANAKTFAPPRDAAAEINSALHDSPGGQTQRQNDELFREAARANGMDELERDPEKGKKLLPSIPSLILKVAIIVLVAIKVCDMALLVLSYSNTDVAALRETVDEPLNQVFEFLSVVFVILLVLMGVFWSAWGSLEPLVAQRLYLGRGRLMLVSNMSQGKVCFTEGSTDPPCITSIESYEVRKRCIVVRGNLCRAAATVEGRHFSLTGEERLDELKIWRAFSEEDELRLLGMLDQMVSTSWTPQERGADTPIDTGRRTTRGHRRF